MRIQTRVKTTIVIDSYEIYGVTKEDMVLLSDALNCYLRELKTYEHIKMVGYDCDPSQEMSKPYSPLICRIQAISESIKMELNREINREIK